MGDNDRLKSRQEADAAFNDLTPEERELVNTGSPEDVKAFLDKKFNSLVKQGVLRNADTPRFRNAFNRETLRSQYASLQGQLDQVFDEVSFTYDENGDLASEVDPEEIWSRELAKIQSSNAWADPAARRQTADELSNIRLQFDAQFAAKQAQAREKAVEDLYSSTARQEMETIIGDAINDGTPIEEADLSGLVRLTTEHRKEFGRQDAQKLLLDTTITLVNQQVGAGHATEAEKLLDRVARLRDENGNKMFRSNEDVDRITRAQEALDREVERQDDRDRTEELQERAIQITRGQSEILRHIYADYDGEVPYEQIDRARRILIDRNYPPEVQGELLQFLTEEIDRSKRRDAASDPTVLRDLSSQLYSGQLEEQEITEAVAAGEISGREGEELRQELQQQGDLYDGMGTQTREILDAQRTRFTIPGATAEVQIAESDFGQQRDQQLRGKLQDYWDTSTEEDQFTRRAKVREIAREHDEESLRLANERRVAFQERTSESEGRLALMEAGYTLTIAAVNKERANLTQASYEDYIRRAQATEYRLDNIRKQVIGAIKNENTLILDTFLSENFIEDPAEANRLRIILNSETDAIGDRFESDILPTLAGSPETGVIKAFREYAQNEYRESLLPQFEPATAEIFRRISEGERPQQAVEDVGASTREVEASVDLEKFPELREYDSKRTPKSAVNAVLEADPKRQTALVRVLAPQLGLKADEVIYGSIRLKDPDAGPGNLRGRLRGTQAPPAQGKRVVIPTDFIAKDPHLKYNTPFFTSKEEFRAYPNERLNSLLKALRIPEADVDRWTELQEDAIERVHKTSN
jgi:soluble P-type ATPase